MEGDWNIDPSLKKPEEFEIPYSEQRLIENWFDFNDNTVNAIKPGKLETTFGGSENGGSAYMLIYRQKTLNPVIPEGQTVPLRPSIPDYQKQAMEEANAQNEKERVEYYDLKTQIEVYIQDQEEMFNVTQNEIAGQQMPLITYKDEENFEQAGIKCRLRMTDTLDEVHRKIT